MIEIKIPKDVRDYKEKLFAGLTLRQTVCLSIALGINVPLYIFIRPVIGDDAAGWAIMFTGVPLFLIGFITQNGMPFEKYLMMMLKFYFIEPRKRVYKVESIYTWLSKEIGAEKEYAGGNKKLCSRKKKKRM